MENAIKLIRERRSVRTYIEKDIEKEKIDGVLDYAKKVKNPFDIPVDFAIFKEEECYLPTPAVVGADYYLCAKAKKGKNSSIAYGYSFQETLLFAQSLGLGSVWLGAIVNRSKCEKLLNATNDEFTPCVSPLGYASSEMSVREKVNRQATNADSRIEFEKLFFRDSFDNPLYRNDAGVYEDLLDGVRRAPSAVNKQPWRVVLKDNSFHFYLKRNKFLLHGENLDMQKVDMGIALCHFSLIAKEKGIGLIFSQTPPTDIDGKGLEYISTYSVKQE